MELETKIKGNILEIFLSGRLDVHLSMEMENAIHELVGNNKEYDLLLNLENINYMSSSGIRIFVSTMRILEGLNKKMKICNMNNSVRKVFEIVELTDMFEIYQTEEQALESF